MDSKHTGYLYDPDLSVSHEQLRREIDMLNTELQRYSLGDKVDGKVSSSTPYTQGYQGRKSDSGIASGRHTEYGHEETNPWDTKQYGFGAKPKHPLQYDPSDYKSDHNKPVPEDFVTYRRPAVKTKKRSITPEADSRAEHKNDSKNTVKPATYDGKGPWPDYKSHFDACAQINKWSETEKGLYLAVSLRGQAQGVLGNLPLEHRQNFKELVKSLEERFAPSNQTELYRTQLRERRQRAIETLPELGQDIRRLANLAYPTAPNDVRETLAKEQFIDALASSDMRLRVKQSRPINLNDAIRHAVELEAFNKAELKREEGQGYLRATSDEGNRESELSSILKNMQTALTDLQKEVKTLKEAKPPQNFNRQHRGTYRGNGRPNHAGMKCFACGKVGHIGRNCPNKQNLKPQVKSEQSNTRGSKETANKTPNSVGVHKLSQEAGMYVKASINGAAANLLIDTGATVTLVSSKLFKTMSHASLSPSQRDILTANGETLHVFGKTMLDIQIDGFKCNNIAVVADINVDGIVGLDFLRSQNANISMSDGIITMQGHEIRFQIQGQIGCYRVSVSETVTLPPRSEVIVSGKIRESQHSSFEVGIVEPADDFRKVDKALVGRTLVNNNGEIPLRLMNVSQQPQTLYEGTIIAKVTPVIEVTVPTGHDNVVCDKVPCHLQDLYERSIKDLTDDQAVKVRNLLQKFSHIFAKTDSDFGRTNIVKHTIETSNAVPVREPPRRVPYHIQQEYDKAIDDMLSKNVIEPSTSPWASGVVLVKKKDGSTRWCVDYRRLNSMSTKDAYPLPRIQDSLSQMCGAQWFCTADLCCGYWQLEVEP